MALKQIDLAYHTLVSELEQRCLDAEFDATFPETGLFKKTKVKERDYWYFHERTPEGKYTKRYVGPDSDPEVAKRVAAFKAIKDDYTARRRLVSTLVNDAMLPRPEDMAGDIVEALWKGGLFRMRAVMIGSVAFGCYPGLLGVRLPAAAMRTTDLDLAQFHSISVSIDDSLPPVGEMLKKIDPTFREIPHQSDSRASTKFVNKANFAVEFLTPNYSKEEYVGKPATMPALGGAAAQPLRFLDFLIANPVRSVVLHRGGVPVRIPAPERYAVHKLIVSSRRRVSDMSEGGGEENIVSKRDKDVQQAGILIEALAQKRRHMDLAESWVEAWKRGPAWREGLVEGRSMLFADQRKMLEEAIRSGCQEHGWNPEDLGLSTSGSMTRSR